nr:zinc ribbon containing protein [Marseillevirus futianmevirus]
MTLGDHKKEKMNCELRKRGNLCGRRECEYCFGKSFASVEKSKHLVEGQGNPLLITRNSGKKFRFECGGCGHFFEMRPNDVSNGHFCPFCSNKKTL